MENNLIIDMETTSNVENNMNVKTYKIEGNIDFYSAIYENNIEEEQEQNIDNICLITGEPLGNHYQTLQCNHKFNYIPLYLYVKQSKYKFNYLEQNPLKITQLKCPYCRNVQNELLPYIEEFDFPKIPGVNHLDEQYKSFLGRCEYVNSKKIQCSSNRVYLLNNRCYCYTHRNVVIHREHKQSMLYKLKTGNKLHKPQIITQQSPPQPQSTYLVEQISMVDIDKSVDIITEPCNISDDKIQMLEDNPSNSNININININKGSVCSYIFIKGLNKGCLCNRKISDINEIYCKKHKK
jgi:hypothetical protein